MKTKTREMLVMTTTKMTRTTRTRTTMTTTLPQKTKKKVRQLWY